MTVKTEKIDTVKKHFECVVCTGEFKSPVQVQCGHIFCTTCLKRLQEKSSACCPECTGSLTRRGGLKPREDVEELFKAFTKLHTAFQNDNQKVQPVTTVVVNDNGQHRSESAIVSKPVNQGPSSSKTNGAVVTPKKAIPVESSENGNYKRPKVVITTVAKIPIPQIEKRPSLPPVHSKDALEIFHDESEDLFPVSNNENEVNNMEISECTSQTESPLDLSITLSSSQMVRRESMRPKVAFQSVSPSVALDLSLSNKRKLDNSELLDLHSFSEYSYPRLDLKHKISVRKSLDEEFMKQQMPARLFSPHPYIPKSFVKGQNDTDMTKTPLKAIMSPPSNFKRVKFVNNNNDKTINDVHVGERDIINENNGQGKSLQSLEKNQKTDSTAPIPKPPRAKPPSFDGSQDQMTCRSDKIIAELDLDSVLSPKTNKMTSGERRVSTDWKSPSPKRLIQKPSVQNGNNSAIKSPTKARTSLFNNNEKEDVIDVESDSSNDSFLCSTPKREEKLRLNQSKGGTSIVTALKGKILSPVRKIPSSVATIFQTPNTILGTASTVPSSEIQDFDKHTSSAEMFSTPLENENFEDMEFPDDSFDENDFDDIESEKNIKGKRSPRHDDHRVEKTETIKDIANFQTHGEGKQWNQRSLPSLPSKESLSTPPKKFVFCATRLSRKQLEKLDLLAKKYGGSVASDYQDDVTHLILTLDNDRVQQTMKYLFAIADKKWIVVFDWVEQCLQQNRMVPETQYETSNYNFDRCDEGVRSSRVSKTRLFDGYIFHVSGTLRSSGSTNETWRNLLTKLGGVVLLETKDITKDVLIVGDSTDRREIYEDFFKTYGAITVSWEWVLDCITSYSVMPLIKDYYLITKLNGPERRNYSVLSPQLFP